ncbi:MAG: cation-transporting P-type ATPase [Cyanobacteria bacterium TGS_CYA1]|nr:cation-transporting P-type ATPase [Cyanobacteria bacterium TGS_CYA1]
MTHARNSIDLNAKGLTSCQAQIRLSRHGLNTISVETRISWWKLVKENFFHTMALLLWLGGFIGFFAGMPQIAIAIWLVNIINGSFSFFQEYSAFRATAALKSLLPETTTVLRDECETQIESVNVVPQDVVILEEGAKIPADCHLIECDKLMVDESTLTGESQAILKELNKDNKIWAGTTVISGHAQALVFATGHSTRFGKIAHLTQTIADRPSPLQLEMKRVARTVSKLACAIGILMFVLACTLTKSAPEQAFIFAMGMIVAFVPEGMVPTVTLSLALAVKKMAKRHALVKRLSCVEALGCTNVICTDKTGTLTENKMKVVEVWTINKSQEMNQNKFDSHSLSNPDFKALFTAGIFCNNAHKKSGHFIGDPTETAILQAAELFGLELDSTLSNSKKVHEEPFDSNRKMMSTAHQINGSDKFFIMAKGSPESILEKCHHYMSNGEKQELTTEIKEKIENAILSYAKSGLRLLAFANRECNQLKEDFEQNLSFVGLLAMQDPPRKEIASAMKRCDQAGIQVAMITGDHEVTAKAIALKTGIIKENAQVINGAKLDTMSDQELLEALCNKENLIFARANPEHKLKIVSAFQKAGKIVAVTGDGVNDGPALKQADIGIAMGKGGTDVAREAADIILLDDNFASIVNAIEEGRTVYENIKKFAVYVFNSNMAEAVPFAAMLFSGGLIPMPLTVMQVLSIDLGTDMLPAIALGADQSEPSVMQDPPRERSTSLLSKNLLCKALLWYGLIEAVAAMMCYFFSNWLNGWPNFPLAPEGSVAWSHATTMTLTGVVACQIGAVFCCRTNTRSLFQIGFFNNKMILAGILFEVGLLCLLMYVPVLQRLFNTMPLSIPEIMFALSFIPIIVLLDETRKYVLRRTHSLG